MTGMKDLTAWTDTKGGKVVVATSILVLGLTHFGWASGVAGMGVGGITVGTVAGAVGVFVGAAMLYNTFM